MIVRSKDWRVPNRCLFVKFRGHWDSRYQRIRTIRRRILETGRMVHCKIEKKPTPKPHLKSQRMLWARNRMSYGLKWQSGIFSDEKKVESGWSRWPGIILA
ncbi:hypothetical protein AVEN_96512-1 [Araneus ventricosus]|uniref:Transposase Tc1-like domain-containing protein n=1 Tax=Araneus ventricosus TaxID=182803 RepID=A0A4Y2CUY0_ARAVE|nr:hypothetical protein AVEN_96512-1 [Araneus ventricosus]